MPAAEPHFVRDYRALTRSLTARYPRPEAMARAVGGGDYEAIGAGAADLLEEIGFAAGHSLIDLGCGSGRLSTQLSKRFGDTIEYLGVDVVPELLSYARERAAAQYRFVLTEGCTVPAGDACADFVAAFSLFTHLRRGETAAYFKDIRRALRPGGRFLFSFLELPYHARLCMADFASRLLGARNPEVHFLSRRAIVRLCHDSGFALERFLPEQRRGICLNRNYVHSFAVLRRA